MNVAVLVDLMLVKKAGGHVKYWQRISEALSEQKIDCHITVFFLGEKNQTQKINKNVKFTTLRPILSSKILRSFGIDADTTDLSPMNPRLFFLLKRFQIIHTTDQFFCMSTTAKLASRFFKIPLTTSIHTDTPPYSKYYVEKIIKKFNFLKINNYLIQTLKLHKKIEQKMLNKVYDFIRCTKAAMVADNIYSPQNLITKTGNKNITKLNRGIDNKIFNSKKNNKDIFAKYNIPYTDKIIFFSGRIHELKGALLLAKIHKRLLKSGISVTTLMAGENIHGKLCKEIAPNKLNLIGYLSQQDLADLYRSCDVFVFPSNFEIGPNVVIEAKACGAVCVVSPNGGGKRIYFPGKDGIIVKKWNLDLWVKTLRDLLKNENKIIKIKKFLESNSKITSWKEVFIKEIFPHWKKVERK